MIIYIQPINEEMGVCNAKPTIREISPNETAAAYQLAKRKEIARIVTAMMLSSRVR